MGLVVHWNVAHLLQSPLGSERVYAIDEAEDRYEELAGKITGAVRLMRTDRGILVRAQLDARVRAECSRCLAPFTEPVSFAIDEVFYPSIDIVHGGKLDRPEDEGAFTIDRRHILDLGEPSRQYALLSLPMKPLCAQECSGLCSTCGVNRNVAACGCPQGGVDPRWALLEALHSETGVN